MDFDKFTKTMELNAETFNLKSLQKFHKNVVAPIIDNKNKTIILNNLDKGMNLK